MNTKTSLRLTKTKILPQGRILSAFVRPEVIETSTYPWQGHVIPLNHGRIVIFLSVTHFAEARTTSSAFSSKEYCRL
jgi:hypothetical protein